MTQRMWASAMSLGDIAQRVGMSASLVDDYHAQPQVGACGTARGLRPPEPPALSARAGSVTSAILLDADPGRGPYVIVVQLLAPRRAPPAAARAGAARRRRGPAPALDGTHRGPLAFDRGVAAARPASSAGSGSRRDRGDRRCRAPPRAPPTRRPRRLGSARRPASR